MNPGAFTRRHVIAPGQIWEEVSAGSDMNNPDFMYRIRRLAVAFGRVTVYFERVLAGPLAFWETEEHASLPSFKMWFVRFR